MIIQIYWQKFIISSMDIENQQIKQQITNQHNYSCYIANEMIKIIKQEAERIIQLNCVILQLPIYIKTITCVQLSQNLTAFEPNYSLNPGKIHEQTLLDIPKLKYDTLMPKQVHKQKITSSDKLNSTIRTNSQLSKIIKRRTALQTPKINSVQLNQKKSKTLADKIVQSNLISLPGPQKEPNDPQLQLIKTNKESIVRQQQIYTEFLKQKAKQFQKKTQQFKQSYNEKGFTYNFEGQVFQKMTDESKLPYYGMRMQVGSNNRKKKQDLKDYKVQKLSLSYNNKKKQTIQQTIDFAKDIPMFSSTNTRNFLLGIPSDVANYNIDQYKKYYGGKFHRKDKSLMNTIDNNSNRESRTIQQDLFSSQRFIKDSQSLKKSNVSNYHQPNTRKLALPKLKGLYKVLDRYENYN